jgi:ABC-type glycerol-3-phosphate transport system permease component
VVAVIWQFTSSWHDYLFAIFLSNTRNGRITVALDALAGAHIPDDAASMAGVLIHVAAHAAGLCAARPMVHRRPDGRPGEELTADRAVTVERDL